MEQDKRDHKVKCHYGLPSYFKYYSKNSDNPVSRKVYMTVLKEYLKIISIAISQDGYMFKLPQRLGKIEIRKNKREVTIDDNGNIKNTLCTNWKATKELWLKDARAKAEKIRIRYTNEHTDGYIFKIVYFKNTANFRNKFVYKMSLNREMRRSTNQPIINHKIDAFLLKH